MADQMTREAKRRAEQRMAIRRAGSKMMASWLSSLLLLSSILLDGFSCEERRQRILVLGGTGFLGSAVLSMLLDKDFEIDMLVRGNKYFDSELELTWRVRTFLCDRDSLLRKTCKELLTSGYYDFVLDFSSFRQVQMDQMLDVLRSRVGLYVYISTEVVYEITMKDHPGLTKEFDDKRPDNETLAQKLNDEHKYGNNKLLCEESLKRQRNIGGFPYVILRVADAIGPRDISMRFWTYQLWIKLHKLLKSRVALPNGIQNKEFSLAYSNDVASAIISIIANARNVHDRVLNIAFDEPITLRMLLLAIGKCHGETNIDFDHDSKTAWYRFPTTTKGQLDISHARDALEGWSPTRFAEAVEQTCTFYASAIVDANFISEREILLATFMEDVVPNEAEDEDGFIEALEDTYGPGVVEGVDLGFTVDPKQPRIPTPIEQPKEEL